MAEALTEFQARHHVRARAAQTMLSAKYSATLVEPFVEAAGFLKQQLSKETPAYAKLYSQKSLQRALRQCN